MVLLAALDLPTCLLAMGDLESAPASSSASASGSAGGASCLPLGGGKPLKDVADQMCGWAGSCGNAALLMTWAAIATLSGALPGSGEARKLYTFRM